jgi:hypothetical protein
MLADDVRLIQSTYPLRAAADVGMFFGIYSRSARCAPPLLADGREVIAVYAISGGEAELPHVAGMDGRPDQLHPRLQSATSSTTRAVFAPDTAPPGRGWPGRFRRPTAVIRKAGSKV